MFTNIQLFLFLNIFAILVSIGHYGNVNGYEDEITYNQMAKLAKSTNMQHLRDTVKEILIPRVVGTKGHDTVRDFIIKSMKTLDWHVERDTFDDNTPNMGSLKFENIIATINPKAKKFLTLACHYDSKYMADIEFLGATDSAVPCAMLINLAHVLKEHLGPLKENKNVGLMFVFFDGEEAFENWGPKDSIYGARHLAAKWDKSGFIKKIDLFVLLDLIGCPDPKFFSFFQSTEEWHARLVYMEERLSAAGFLDNYTTNSVVKSLPNRYFQPNSANSYIEDDHVPFLKLGVPVLHMIPMPFPKEWHTKEDNHDIIDYTTVENINKILRIFILEYFGEHAKR